MTRYPKPYVYRDDHVPGYVYLIEAINVTGIIPGKLVRRCKIGLSRNPELRLQNFIDNQPPCNFRIVKAIYVQDMASVEDELHAKFKHCNIKLEKSREWHNFNPWQYAMVLWAFSRYESQRISFQDIPVRLIAGGLVALLGVGMLIGQAMKEPQPQVQPSVEAIPEQR
ncbi:GIY-YIG nuclease family protein [Scytonema sp. PCC 10023]|uniref:GIY-YIG nuclease family protein n=1 Tax=Scytonema sp. PCC 10023 TaxID=1680591 RepID=UPI0039C67ACE